MMKRYNSYKDSRVEWIGEIPSSWNKSKFKFVSELQTGNSLNENQKVQYESENIDDIPYVSSKDIDVNFQTVNYNNGLRIPKNNNTFKISPKGSFLMVIEGGSSGRKMVFLEQDVCFVNKLCSFHSTQSTKFQYYFVQSINYQDIFKLSMSGLIGGVSISKLRDFEIILPPLPEQQQIVSFLDTKTALIDSLIEKTIRKIELLKEKRTSLINEVVTKGLNPNVEMKDSGVEWIGEIPSHWDIKRVKHLIEDYGGIKIGPFGSSLKLDTLTEDGIKVYGQGNVIKDDFTLGHRHIPLERFKSDFTQYEIFEGDVLITMMGTTGKSKVFKKSYKKGILDSHLLRLRFKKNSFISELFVTILQESDYVFNQLKLTSKGSIMEGLNSSIVKELTLMTPPISEQQQIVSFLDEQTQLIDKTISIEERRIERLKEYRQSLISEVVTGKQKVVNDE